MISDTELVSVQTAKSGIFETMTEVGARVRTGTPLANIIDPYEGTILETLYAPCDSTVFFMHSDPLTYANTAVFKLVPKEET